MALVESERSKRIEYASPGFKDFAGVGEAIGHLKDFLGRLIDLVTTRRQRKLENEKLALENQRIAIDNQREDEKRHIENAGSLVRLAKECGCTQVETRQMFNRVATKESQIIPLIDDGKTSGVEDRDG